MILNVGCGGRPNDRGCSFGDVRVDVERFPNAIALMDAHCLGFQDKTFDRIVCFEVLEHLETPFVALREFLRVLKDDGTVLVTIPNVWYWRLIAKALKDGKERVANELAYRDHRFGWSVFEFCSMASHGGFIIVDYGWLDWYKKGKLKTGFLEPLLRVVPAIAFMHVHFTLKKEKRNE